jgi:hypothetical protein
MESWIPNHLSDPHAKPSAHTPSFEVLVELDELAVDDDAPHISKPRTNSPRTTALLRGRRNSIESTALSARLKEH